MIKMKKVLISLLVLLIFISPVLADNSVNLYFFYGQGCPHCGRGQMFLSEMQTKYPTLHVYEYEVYSNNENRDLFEHYSLITQSQILGVPTTFLDQKAYPGFSNQIGEDIEAEIQRCLIEQCSDFNNHDDNSSITPLPYQNIKEEIIGWSAIILVVLSLASFLLIKFIRKKRGKK